jgi:hypothetical protein
MKVIKPSDKLVTSSVWDLHLHHVVWLAPGGGPTFASGEEKTIVKMPQGYGNKVGADANGGLNYMIHSLNASSGRSVYGSFLSAEVTTGSNEYTTPELTDPGTYTYFCRIHPFMRGSVRVE